VHRIVHGRGAGTACLTAQATPGIQHACELLQQPRQQPDPSSQVTVLQEDLRCAESLRPRALLHPRPLVPGHWRVTGHAQAGPPQALQAELGRLTGRQAGDPQAPAGAGRVREVRWQRRPGCAWWAGSRGSTEEAARIARLFKRTRPDLLRPEGPAAKLPVLAAALHAKPSTHSARPVSWFNT